MDSKQFLADVVTHLTGKTPTIEVQDDEYGAVFTLGLNGNISALIGKNGVTIDAVRTIMKAIGYNGKHRIKVVLHEPSKQQSTG